MGKVSSTLRLFAVGLTARVQSRDDPQHVSGTDPDSDSRVDDALSIHHKVAIVEG
jgi:hypothetical protein